MTSFRVVHATTQDWAQAAKICADGIARPPGGFSLGIVYATDPLAGDLPSILTFLRHKTGVEHWVGCVAPGICAMAGNDRYEAGEYFDRPALAVMAMALGEDDFHVLASFENDAGQLPDETRRWIEERGACFGVVHGDPANPLVPSLIEQLSAVGQSFLVGGLSSSRQCQIAGRVCGGGLSGVMLAPDLGVVTTLSQGCAPVSERHLVSDCIDNIVIGLDGRPALDVFREDIGEDMSDSLDRIAGQFHVALAIEGSDTGDYLVRSLVGIDPERGWLAIGEQVRSGQRLLFVRRDPLSAETDMRKRLETLRGRLNRPPRAGLYFSCVGRGPSMFGGEGRELAIIRDVFGDLPLIGFFGNGEISNSRLHEYTGVLCLFP